MSLFDIISYNSGKGDSDGNNYWKKVTVPHYIYIGLMLVLMGTGIGLVSLFVTSAYLNELGWEMFLSYLSEPVILIMNLLPCVLFVLFFYFATGRAWAAFSLSGLIVFAFTLVEYYKVSIRSETLRATDLTLINEAVGIISRYRLEISGRVMLTILSFIFGVLFAVFFMRGKLRKPLVRIIGSVLIAAVIILLAVTIYQDDNFYANNAVNNTADYNQWVDLELYISKGFVYSFIYSIKDLSYSEPEGYTDEIAQELLSEYKDEDIPDEKKVNIIAVMLEAYTDLSEHDEIPVYSSVYEPLNALREESLHGHIIANTFAGGTVNTERAFLTGYTANEDYHSATNSYIYYLRSQGYYTEGFHSGEPWFYNRKNVQANLGMQNYYFLEDYDTEDYTDRFFFETLSELYENRDKDTPYFNFSITYQNHGSYGESETCETAYLDGSNMSVTSYNILNNYLEGIADTSSRMLSFVDSFRDSPEPVIIVFFGDHMPWLGDNGSVYSELGVNIDTSTEEGFYNYYSTPYIIWANDAAKDCTGGSFTGDGGNMSSCFLMSRLFTECGLAGSAFMQYNRMVYNTVNIINTGSGIYCVNGELTQEPDTNLIGRLRYVQTYMKENFLYDEYRQ